MPGFELRTCFRQRNLALQLRVVSAVFGVLLVAPALDSTASPLLRAIAATMALLFIAIGWFWLPRLGMHADDEGVRLVRILSSARVDWEEIDRFEARRAGVRVHIDLVERSGRWHQVPGIQQNSKMCGDGEEAIEDPVEHLNAHLAWRRGQLPAPDKRPG